MKVEKITEDTIPFSNIKCGDVFEYKNKPWIKCDSECEELKQFLALCLINGTTEKFEGDTKVIPKPKAKITY